MWLGIVINWALISVAYVMLFHWYGNNDLGVKNEGSNCMLGFLELSALEIRMYALAWAVHDGTPIVAIVFKTC